MTQGMIALVVIWGLVFATTTWSGRNRVTPEQVADSLVVSDFADWSGKDPATMNPEERARRKAKLDELANMVLALDWRESSQILENDDYFALALRLSDEEGQQLVDRLLGEGGQDMLELFDQLDPKTRQEMVERTIRKYSSGANAEKFACLQEENPNLVRTISMRGAKWFLKESSVKTKLELVPFFNTVRESLKGFGKPDFGGL